jgi:hypothetical protein
MSQKKRVNATIVRQAMTELSAQGKNPSVRALLAHIGYGSMGTIAKYKNQIEGEGHRATTSEPAEDVFEIARAVLNEMLPILEERIQDHLHAVFDIPTQHIDYQTLQSHLRTTQEELRQRESELREMRHLYHSVLADRSEKTRAAIVLKQRLNKLKQELQDKNQYINQLELLAPITQSLADATTAEWSSISTQTETLEYAELIEWNMPTAAEATAAPDLTDLAAAQSRAWQLYHADPSQSAQNLCDQLQAEGYRRATLKQGLRPYTERMVANWMKYW